MSTRVFTYDELAEHFGISRKSAQNLARKRGWSKTIGNDRKARIQVPLDDEPERPSKGQPEGPQEVNEQVSLKVENRVLQAKIEGLERALEAEKQRADAMELDRDRWHAQATRPRSWREWFR